MKRDDVIDIWGGDKHQAIADLRITTQGFNKWEKKHLGPQQALHVIGAAVVSGRLTAGIARRKFHQAERDFSGNDG